jgi:hypothetical protein
MLLLVIDISFVNVQLLLVLGYNAGAWRFTPMHSNFGWRWLPLFLW